MCSKVDLDRPDVQYALQVIECVVPLGDTDVAWMRSVWKGLPSPGGIDRKHGMWVVNVVAVVTRTMFLCGKLEIAVQIQLMDLLEQAITELPVEPSRFQHLRQQVRELHNG